jgi:hypothetical protein
MMRGVVGVGGVGAATGAGAVVLHGEHERHRDRLVLAGDRREVAHVLLEDLEDLDDVAAVAVLAPARRATSSSRVGSQPCAANSSAAPRAAPGGCVPASCGAPAPGQWRVGRRTRRRR